MLSTCISINKIASTLRASPSCNTLGKTLAWAPAQLARTGRSDGVSCQLAGLWRGRMPPNHGHGKRMADFQVPQMCRVQYGSGPQSPRLQGIHD